MLEDGKRDKKYRLIQHLALEYGYCNYKRPQNGERDAPSPLFLLCYFTHLAF